MSISFRFLNRISPKMDDINAKNFELTSFAEDPKHEVMNPPQTVHQDSLVKAASIQDYIQNGSPAKIYPKSVLPKEIIDKKNRKRDALKSNHHLPRKIEGKYNAEAVRILKAKLKKSDSACVAISCFGLTIAWLESELYYTNKNDSDTTSFVLRILITSSCFILHFFVYNHYKLKIEILKALRIIYQGTSFWDSNLTKYYILESLFCWIHSPPGLNFDVSTKPLGNTYDISINAIISVIMLGRLFIFLRLFDHYTFWTSERAVRVCRLMGFTPDTKFAVKALLKYKAILMVSLSIGLSTFFFALIIQVFERDGPDPRFRIIWNCLWCVIVTMATIGYGDIYPITFLGRIVMIVACIWGVFLLSMFVVTLNNITQLTKEENSAYEEIIKHDKIKNTLSKDARKIISLFIKLHLKKNKTNTKKKMLLRMDYLGLIKRFRIKRRNVNNESKSTLNQLEDIHETVTAEMIELMEMFEPIKVIIPQVEESEKMQGKINEKTVRIFENSKRIHTLLLNMNKGKRMDGIHSMGDVYPMYDYKGNLKVNDISNVVTANNIVKP